MNLIRRLLYAEMAKSILFVTLVFLGLFYFFDFSDEAALHRAIPSYALKHAAVAALWLVPTHVYELLPITTLIGTIYALSHFAQTSEFTIMRISGLGPFRMLRYTLLFGVLGAILSFVTGDYLAPLARQRMEAYKMARGAPPDTQAGKTGTWLRDSVPGGGQRIINLREYDFLSGAAGHVTVYELNTSGQISSLYRAARAQFLPKGKIQLLEPQHFKIPTTGAAVDVLPIQTLPELTLDTDISAEIVATSLLQPERMSTVALYQYIQHLQDNGQDASRHAIEFWRKVFYPISALVMVVLALPFAYLHVRSQSVALSVFIGVMLGISFFLMNNVAGHLGYLNLWTPWVASATPGLVYSALSLIAFTHLVLRH